MVYLLTEDGNTFLKGRKFMPGETIIKHLKNTLAQYDGDESIEGYDRLVNLIDMIDNKGGIEYNEMKRLQNYFDNNKFSKETETYKLNGGKVMDMWVRNKLRSARIAAANMAKMQKEINKATQKDTLKVVKPKMDASFKSHKKFIGNLLSL